MTLPLRERLASWLPLILAGVALAAHLAVGARYGWHRDEFYYLACGLHPGWGYVDHPPLVPLLGRLGWAALGETLLGLRLPAMLAHAGLVWLSARLARELGGRGWAQGLAAFGALLAPLLLGASAMLTSVVFDVLAWSVALYAALRLLNTRDPRWWLALGAVLGLGLLTKYTIALLGAGLLVGVIATDARQWLRTPWPWAAAALALVIWLPNARWQAAHGWPFLEFAAHNGANVRAEQSRLDVVASWLLMPAPGGAVLWLLGLGALAWNRVTRPLAWAAGAVLVAVLALNAKAYYIGGLYPLGFAAGAVAVEAWTAERRRWARWLALGAVAFGVVAVPLVLPVLPLETALAQGVDSDFAEQLGWPAFAEALAEVHRGLPPDEQARAVVYAGSYGQAGAVARYGPALGLPPAVSAHNTHAFWARPDTLTADVVIAPVDLSDGWSLWETCERRGTFDNGLGVDNEEQGAPLYVCRGRTRSWAEAWPSLTHFD